jgi:transposase
MAASNRQPFSTMLTDATRCDPPQRPFGGVVVEGNASVAQHQAQCISARKGVADSNSKALLPEMRGRLCSIELRRSANNGALCFGANRQANLGGSDTDCCLHHIKPQIVDRHGNGALTQSRCSSGRFDAHDSGAGMMGRTSLQAVSPAGLVIDTVTLEADQLLVIAHPSAPDAACTACGERSSQIHSRYQRRLLDLPSPGRSVRLHVQVRRFRCDNAGCDRKIFGEVLNADIASKAARRASRLEAIVHHIGIALGGRPAASLARRLMLPVSRDRLLRVVRRRAMPSGTAPVRIVGIDDFAWKRGQRYGTIVCDLEQRRVVDLLPDRETATVAAWLAAHPETTIVSRDRGGSYGQAATQGAAQAVQVADRWPLMENASAAFLETVRRSMPSIRKALASSEIDPALLTSAERIQHDGFLRRQESNKIIKDLVGGWSVDQRDHPPEGAEPKAGPQRGARRRR